MIPKIHVGSVHFQNDFWLEHQLKFLRENTTDFYYAVYLNNIENKSAFSDIKVIGENDKKNIEMHDSHVSGLNHILQYFQSCHSEYFLILDSDCFPVKANWLNYLLKKMTKQVAAVVRYEALSDMPHPCAILFHKTHLPSIKFKTILKKNLIGQTLPIVTLDHVPPFYPLLRTNKWNPHPISAGIYANCFYHHCCGSRKVVGGFNYCDLSITDSDHIQKLITKSFVNNSTYFIAKLTGRQEMLL